MNRKTKNFLQQEKESEEYLKKLTSVTKQRKKDSSKTFHKFELIKHLQELNIHQQKLEEDLRSFLVEKNLKSILDEDEALRTDRIGYHKNIYIQLETFTSLVKDLKTSLPLFEKLIKEGKKSESKSQWVQRKEALISILNEIKNDFIEREEFVLSDYSEDFPDFENEEKPDQFLLDLPQEVPGLNIAQIASEYKEAKSKVNDLFDFKLQSIKDPKHSWDIYSHSKFIYIYRQYIEKAKPRERYMERLILEFPSLSRQDLEKHDKIVESLRWNNKHRKNIKKDQENHLQALQKAAEDLLEQQMDQAIEKFNKEILFVQQEKQQNRLTQEYQERKIEFMQRVEAKERARLELEEKNRLEKIKKEKERTERIKNSKKVAGEYKGLKRTTEEMEKIKKEKEEIERNKKIKEDLERNKEKVEYRKAVEQQKLIERLDEQELSNLRKAQEAARLEKAVSQYSHLPKVEIDPERVQKNTKSKEAKKNPNDLADKAVLYQQTGFTVDNLMKDMRYKLSHILTEAGLQNSEYGKRVLQSVPHQNPRRDTISSHFK